MDDLYLFQSMVVVGSIVECKKWIDFVQNSREYQYFRLQSCGFANFEAESSRNASNLLDPVNLQRQCAQKILDTYRTHKNQKSHLESLPEELLVKIVEEIPLVIPVLQSTDDEGKTKASFKLNFEELDAFINIIKNTRPDIDNNFGDQFNNREGILYFSLKNGLHMPSTTDLPVMLKENNINISIVARDSCDWDDNIRNHYTKVFVIEKNDVVFERKDLPQRIEPTDHLLVHKYGHLLKNWEQIWHESRTEFTSETLGDFKQIWKI